jgi:preprotein translocase subunit SecD
MRNAYPVWVYALIAVAILAGGLYALPNIFPEDPAVQVSNTRTGEVDPAVASIIDVILGAQGLEARQVEEREGQLLLRYDSADHQLRAADVLRGALDDDHVVALNLAPATPQWLRTINGRPMSLGLDLRGGVHFLMEVDLNAVIGTAMERYTNEFRGRLREEQLTFEDVERSARNLTVTFASEGDRAAALSWLRSQYRTELAFLERGAGEDSSLEVTLDDEYLTELRRLALQQNISTLRKRVDELGVAEPIIAQQGESRIVVQLPGVQDTARAKEILGATATLEFRMVAEGADAFEAQQTGRAPSGHPPVFRARRSAGAVAAPGDAHWRLHHRGLLGDRPGYRRARGLHQPGRAGRAHLLARHRGECWAPDGDRVHRDHDRDHRGRRGTGAADLAFRGGHQHRPHQRAPGPPVPDHRSGEYP